MINPNSAITDEIQCFQTFRPRGFEQGIVYWYINSLNLDRQGINTSELRAYEPMIIAETDTLCWGSFVTPTYTGYTLTMKRKRLANRTGPYVTTLTPGACLDR
jgi:hypothetical protein